MKTINIILLLLSLYLFATNAFGQVYSQFSPGSSSQYDVSVSGICLFCGVDNPVNAVNPGLTDYATMNVPVGIASTVSLRVDLSGTAVAGSYAGLAVRRVAGLVDASVLGSITIRTYMNGVLRETKVGSTQLLSIVIGGSGQQSLNFLATQDFNQIEISISGLVGVANSMEVYYGYGGGGSPLKLDPSENPDVASAIPTEGSVQLIQSHDAVMLSNKTTSACTYKIEMTKTDGTLLLSKEISVEGESSAVVIEKISNEQIVLIKTTDLTSTDRDHAVQLHKIIL